ncbi:MAG: exodeoxyribonuclease VII large subunit, partial [Solirubrobacteraceae bacterium]
SLCRAPREQIGRQRLRLHQQIREARAGARRRVELERALNLRRLGGLQAKAQGAANACRQSRAADLERLALALAAHDPQRTLERGYALAFSSDGTPLASAAQARQQHELELRFADGSIAASIRGRSNAHGRRDGGDRSAS